VGASRLVGGQGVQQGHRLGALAQGAQPVEPAQLVAAAQLGLGLLGQGQEVALVGGYGPAMAAKEALTRALSAELAPRGIRVVGLRPQAMPETGTIKEAFEPRAKASGMTWEQWQALLASRTHPRRLMTLAELASVAVFMASDKASGMTGTTVNLTMGGLDD
jgi:NAD(P)-dependent dehydrogenase (short-subunit alcohol dehydrogenase family)